MLGSVLGCISYVVPYHGICSGLGCISYVVPYHGICSGLGCISYVVPYHGICSGLGCISYVVPYHGICSGLGCISYVVLMIYYVCIIVIYYGMCVWDMANILCEVVFLTFIKTYLKLCQQVVRVLGDG